MAIIIAGEPDSKAGDMVTTQLLSARVMDALKIGLEILKQVEAQPI